MNLRLSAIVLLFLSLACSDPTGSRSSPAPTRITALPRALTAGEQRIIEADNRLAIKLLNQVSVDTRDTLPNLFISPLSVAMALGMTYNGAAGTTEEAMRATLELDSMSLAEVNEANRSLIALLRGLDPQVRFQIANSIWYREEFAVEPAFLDATRTYFDARVEALDFHAPTAPRTINDWVNQQTNGLIPAIVPDPMPVDQLMYLINAIYFKGDWTQQFHKALTRPRPFRLSDGTSVDVPTMTYEDKGNVRLARTSAATVVDLPYGGEAFSMTIVLPGEGTTVEELVGSLTLEQWSGWITNLHSTRAELFLPKFKLENNFNLNATLAALGMGVAFTEFADFTRMTPNGGVLITDVLHRTYVDVDEEGTEAAAVTAVGMGVVCACQPPPIRIDRPFLFALRENLSGTILFMGVIRHPKLS
jgi:serine protease inhibitor